MISICCNSFVNACLNNSTTVQCTTFFSGSTIYKFKYDPNATHRLLQQITNDKFVEDYTYDFNGNFLDKTNHLGRIEGISSQKETEMHTYRPQIWPSREENSSKRILLPEHVGCFKIYLFLKCAILLIESTAVPFNSRFFATFEQNAR